MQTTVQVQGVKETLRILKQVHPELRKALIKEMRTAAKPLVQEIQRQLPVEAPLSGMDNDGRLAWNSARVKRSVKLKVGGKKVRSQRGQEFPLLRVTIADPDASMFDMAGRGGNGNTPQGQAMIRNLSRFGAPSRTAYPSADKRLPEVTKGVLDAIDKAAAQINREIKRVD